MTLYLKYRPQKLEDLDLESVATTLKKIVESENIPHAFLFAGPKGTGKTSAARILAKVINCTSKNSPCGECEQCLTITKGTNIDVIEMDAASHRGIDDIRELKEAVKLSPTVAKKKIYILDEAHMLTTEASNALLKTLEEPPAHVVFILATTNPEKLISTIKSRTTLVQFKKAGIEEIKKSLKRVVDGEKIKIKDEDLELIAKRANGAFRDAVKLLEQYVFDSGSVLGSGETNTAENFVNILLAKKKDEAIEVIEGLVENGVSVENFLKEVLENIQLKLIKGENDLVYLSELLLSANSQMSDTPIEQLPLEIAVVKYCSEEGEVRVERKVIEEKVVIETKPEIKDQKGEIRLEGQKEETSKKKVKITGKELDLETWKKILSKVRTVNASVEALLKSSHPAVIAEDKLNFGVYYKFHKDTIEQIQYRKMIEDVVYDVTGINFKISCSLEEPRIKKPALTESKDQDIIKAAQDIFGN